MQTRQWLSGVLVVVLVAAASLVHAYYPDEVFAERDAQRVREAILAQQKDGKWGDAHHTFFAVRALTGLGASVPQADKLCTRLKELLAKTAEIQTVYEVVLTADALKCSGALPESASKVLTAALASDALIDLHYAVQTVATLAAAKHAAATDFDLTSVVTKVLDMADDDNSYRSSSSSESEGSALNAGMAYAILGTIFAHTHNLDNAVKDQIRQAMEKVDALVEDESKLAEAPAAAAVLQGLAALASGLSEQLAVPEAAVAHLCEQMVENKYAQGLDELYYLVTGLKVCANNHFNVPLVASVLPPAAGAAAPSQIKVTNVMDAFVAKVKVQLRKAEKEDPITLASTADNTIFALDCSKWAPGLYKAHLTLTPLGEDEHLHTTVVQRPLKVAAALKLDKLVVFVSDSAKLPANDPSDAQQATFPGSLKAPVVAAPGKFVHLKLSVSGSPTVQPAQVFLRLYREKAGKSAYFVATASSPSLYILRLEAASAEMVEALRALGAGSGAYSMEWLVGDAALPSGVAWPAGQIELPPLPKELAKSKAETVEEELRAKPEIAHTFRVPEERPHVALPVAFTVIVLLPLAVLLVKLLSMKLTVSLPQSIQELLYASVFQGALLFTLALYAVYWFKLNVFRALLSLGIVAPVLIISGQHALRALHARSLAKLKST